MRLKLNDVSYTVSEMPRDFNGNITQEEDFYKLQEDTLANEQDEMKIQDLDQNMHQNEIQEQRYQMTAIKRPKSTTLQPGRLPFKGTIQNLNLFDREKSLQKGQKMQKINSQIKLLQSRINNLQRQEEKSTKRVGKMQKTKSQIMTNRQQFETVKDQKYEKQLKRQQELEEMKNKIASMKKNNDEIRNKIRNDQMRKQQSQREKSKIACQQIKDQLNQSSVERMERNKSLSTKVRDQKKLALERRKSQEKEFIEHIQYQYHKDRKQKLNEIWQREEQIKKLEEKEKILIDQLQHTIMREQMEALELRQSIDSGVRKDINESFNSPIKQQRTGSDVLLEVYQTPRTTRHLLEQQMQSSNSKSLFALNTLSENKISNIKAFSSSNNKNQANKRGSVTARSNNNQLGENSQKSNQSVSNGQNIKGQVNSIMQNHEALKQNKNNDRANSSGKNKDKTNQIRIGLASRMTYQNIQPIMQQQKIAAQASLLQKSAQSQKQILSYQIQDVTQENLQKLNEVNKNEGDLSAERNLNDGQRQNPRQTKDGSGNREFSFSRNQAQAIISGKEQMPTNQARITQALYRQQQLKIQNQMSQSMIVPTIQNVNTNNIINNSQIYNQVQDNSNTVSARVCLMVFYRGQLILSNPIFSLRPSKASFILRRHIIIVILNDNLPHVYTKYLYHRVVTRTVLVKPPFLDKSCPQTGRAKLSNQLINPSYA
ncbi:UNKNOWN [Stylonychia lemnae]|uniref:Uncharacterized protein n=1 Tax=Stylonychia lemnae TaxID=5949 RepID=A0A078A283_STYLE|nr:UNKNOWN [Stylonychia lemnae]|eukprot:CDW74874.1 UNKNOWN [Stylonychia lemnae]